MISETSTPVPASSDVVAMPEVTVPAWAWMVVVAAAFAMYFVTMENGALLGNLASNVHEFFHDGRHFGAVPCH